MDGRNITRDCGHTCWVGAGISTAAFKKGRCYECLLVKAHNAGRCNEDPHDPCHICRKAKMAKRKIFG